MRMPLLRSSPETRSASKTPKRKIRRAELVDGAGMAEMVSPAQPRTFERRCSWPLTTDYRFTHSQNRRLIKMPPKYLQSNRQLFRGLAAWHGEPRNAGEVGCHRIDVRQVHRQGIIYLLAQLEGRRRTCRCNNRVDLHECRLEVARQQGPHLLRL